MSWCRCDDGRRRDEERGRVCRGERHAVHDPADEHVNDVGLQRTVRRHGVDQGLVRVFRIGDGMILDDLQQVGVLVARENVLVHVVAGGQDFLVGGHQVIVVRLAGAVTGDAVAFDDGLDVDIVRRHFTFRQRREERLERLGGNLETVIPHVAHEDDDVVNVALAQAFGVVHFSEWVHARLGSSIGNHFSHRGIVERVKHVMPVDGRNYLSLQTLHTFNRRDLAVVAVTLGALDRVQILTSENLVNESRGDFNLFGFGISRGAHADDDGHRDHRNSACHRYPDREAAPGRLPINIASDEVQPDEQGQRRGGDPQSADGLQGGGDRQFCRVGGGGKARDNGQQHNVQDDRAHDGQGKDSAGIMPVGGFVQKRQESQQADADAWDEHRRKPFDLADNGDLSVEREELEEKQEIPFGARDVGGVRRVGLGFACHADEGGQQDEQEEDAQRNNGVFEDAVGPEEFALVQLAFVALFDLFFGFVVHVDSIVIASASTGSV